MPRTALPYATPDISALARFLRDQLAARPAPPGHVGMLNLLARAAGARNFQHFRTLAEPQAAAPAASPTELERVERVARQFDAQGRLVQWPAKPSQQALALWAFWARMPSGESFTEQAMNAFLNGMHLFGDPAILRRSLVSAGLVSRTLDCRDYRRIERQPPPEALALIRRLGRERTAP